MQNKKKILSLIISIFVLFTNATYAGTHVVNTEEEFFQYLIQDIEKGDEQISIKINKEKALYDVDILGTLLKKSGYVASMVKNHGIHYISEFGYTNIDYSYEQRETAQQIDEINAKIDTILTQIIKPDMDVYQKEKAIHDWIVNNVQYDTTYTRYTSYEALFGTKTTVCNGYALLAYRMLNKVGIPTLIVTGKGNGENHAWNLVNLEGNWYHVDLTWDDPIDFKNPSYNNPNYNYFNLRTEEISQNHTIETIIPQTASISFEDLIKNKATQNPGKYDDILAVVVLEKINNFDQLVQYVSNAINSGKTQVKFVYYNKSSLQSDLSKLYNYVSQLGEMRYSYSDNIRTTSTSDCIVTLNITTTTQIKNTVTALKFAQTSVEVRKGKTYDLKQVLNVYPLGIESPSLTWTSSNNSIATVDNGVVTANSAGTATIKVSSANNSNIYASITVKVPVDVESISVYGITTENPKLTLKINSVYSPRVIITPTNATYKQYIVTSDNTNIVEVDTYGKLIAKNKGTANVTISSKDDSSKKIIIPVEVVIPVTSIEISSTPTTMRIGSSSSINAVAYPENASDRTLIYESKNPDIATVDENGNVTAKAMGTATINIYSKSDPKVKKSVRIKTYVGLDGIEAQDKELTVAVGKTFTPYIVFNPTNATIKKVTYQSSDSNIVEVVNGRLLAKAAGDAIITITAEDGGHKATMTVHVFKPVTSIGLDKTSLTLTKGSTSKLTATIYPQDATNKEVIWESSDLNIVEVDQNGNITAKSVGKAIIKVKSKADNTKYKTCIIYVK